jgi:hypothetical protein
VLKRAPVVFLFAACGGQGVPEQPAPGRPAAPDCPAGDVVVRVDEEAAALAGCAAITGDLVIGPSFALSSVTALERIEEVGGSLEIASNAALAGVFLPGLRRVAGSVTIESNLQAETVSLHHLIDVGGDLVVEGNRSLVRLDLSALATVRGRLQVSDHPVLDSVSLDALASAGDLAIEGNPGLPAADIAALRTRLAR